MPAMPAWRGPHIGFALTGVRAYLKNLLRFYSRLRY